MIKSVVSFLLIAGMSAVTTGCLKDNSNAIPAVDCASVIVTAPVGEISTLQHRLDSLGISSTTIKDPHGFFYSMDSTQIPDSADHATPCSNIAVTYSIAKLKYRNELCCESVGRVLSDMVFQVNFLPIWPCS